MSKHLTFSNQSKARNVWLAENGSQELNEYTVPTKENRNAYPMTHKRFNASGPQSSAVRLGRATKDRMWNPEHSAATTYTLANDHDEAARENVGRMRILYGNNWVNATVRRNESDALYNRTVQAADMEYKATIADIQQRYTELWGVLPETITLKRNANIKALKEKKKNGTLKNSNYQKQRSRIEREANKAIDRLSGRDLRMYDTEMRDAKSQHLDAREEANNAKRGTMRRGRLSTMNQGAQERRLTYRAPFQARLNAATRVAAAETV